MQSRVKEGLAMFLRRGPRVLLAAANTGSGESGGIVERLRNRFATGKILRPDVADDVLRQPVEESKFRFPSPG